MEGPGSVGFFQDKVDNCWFVPFPWPPREPGAFKGVDAFPWPWMKAGHSQGWRSGMDADWSVNGRGPQGADGVEDPSSCCLPVPWAHMSVNIHGLRFGLGGKASQMMCCAVLSRSLVSDSWDPMDCSPPDSSVHGNSPGKNTGGGCHALLQGIFPTQYCRRILYWLNHQSSLPWFPEVGLTLRIPCNDWCHKCLFTCFLSHWTRDLGQGLRLLHFCVPWYPAWHMVSPTSPREYTLGLDTWEKALLWSLFLF